MKPFGAIRNRSLFLWSLLASGLIPAALANPVLPSGTWVDVGPVGIDKSSLYSMIAQGLAVDPNNPSNLWWCNGPYQPNENNSVTGLPNGGLYKSTDGGSTWTKSPPADNPLHIRINPDNSKQMYLCDGVRGSYGGFWASNDGGTTWIQSQGYINTTNDAVVGTNDLYEVHADPADFTHVIVSYHGWWKSTQNSSGVLESMDGGNSWLSHNPASGMSDPGFAVSFLYDPALGIGDKNTWIIGCQGGGYWRTSDAGATWTEASTETMPHGGNQIYYAKTGIVYSGGYPNLQRSSDNGVTWQPLTSGLPTGSYYSVVGDGQNLYTAQVNGGVFYTSPETDGVNWKQLNSKSFGYGPFEQAIDKVNGILYASCWGDGLWAYKIPNFSTQVITKPTAATTSLQMKNSRNRLVVSSGTALQVENMTGNAVTLYDVKGRLIARSKIGATGR